MSRVQKKPVAKKAVSKRLASSFKDFLVKDGTANEINAIAIKRVLAWQLQQAMEKAHISKNEMARAMSTSRILNWCSAIREKPHPSGMLLKPS